MKKMGVGQEESNQGSKRRDHLVPDQAKDLLGSGSGVQATRTPLGMRDAVPWTDGVQSAKVRQERESRCTLPKSFAKDTMREGSGKR